MGFTGEQTIQRAGRFVPVDENTAGAAGKNAIFVNIRENYLRNEHLIALVTSQRNPNGLDYML